jgi:hypothetical protein
MLRLLDGTLERVGNSSSPTCWSTGRELRVLLAARTEGVRSLACLAPETTGGYPSETLLPGIDFQPRRYGIEMLQV